MGFEVAQRAEAERTMGQWRDLMVQADAAKRTMLNDRTAGEQEFENLLAAHARDGMIYFKRGEAYEALGERDLEPIPVDLRLDM
jgi:hypothetical protein